MQLEEARPCSPRDGSKQNGKILTPGLVFFQNAQYYFLDWYTAKRSSCKTHPVFLPSRVSPYSPGPCELRATRNNFKAVSHTEELARCLNPYSHMKKRCTAQAKNHPALCKQGIVWLILLTLLHRHTTRWKCLVLNLRCWALGCWALGKSKGRKHRWLGRICEADNLLKSLQYLLLDSSAILNMVFWLTLKNWTNDSDFGYKTAAL